MKSSELGKRIWRAGVLVVVAFACSSASASTNRMLSLDGSTGYVSVPDSHALRLSQTDFTLSCWLQINSYKELGNSIMEKRISGSGSGWIFELQGSSQGDNTAKKIIYGASQGGDPYVAGGTEVSTGTWHHVAVSFTLATSNAVLYLDGKMDGQGIVWSPISVSNSLFIGYSTLGHPYYFDGRIDDIQIWSKALTACEIRSAMEVRPTGTESNLIAYWNFDNGTAADATTNLQHGTFVGGASTLADTDAVTAGVYLAIEVPFRSGSPLTRYQLQYTTDLLSGSWINVGQPVSGNGGELSLFDGPRGATPRFYRVESVYGTLAVGLVAYYPFNGNANDESGNGNDGATSNIQFRTDSAQPPRTVAYFDGTAGIEVPESSSLQLGHSMTLAAWVKISSWGTMGVNTSYPLVVLGDTSTWPSNPHQEALLCQINPNSADFVIDSIDDYPNRVAAGDRASSSPSGTIENRVLGIQEGLWAHIVWTYDGTNIVTFLNGARLYQNEPFANANNLSPYTGYKKLRIGHGMVGNNPPALQGDLKDVRIYNRALSSNEVQQLHNLPY